MNAILHLLGLERDAASEQLLDPKSPDVVTLRHAFPAKAPSDAEIEEWLAGRKLRS